VATVDGRVVRERGELAERALIQPRRLEEPAAAGDEQRIAGEDGALGREVVATWPLVR
jgi:hypothetical protein